MAKKIPMRQCIGCGEMKSKKELLRILRTQEEEILLDATGRKNGRGAYICPNAECLKRAKKSKGLERSFKMKIDEEIYDSLTKEIEIFEKSIRNAGNGDESR
ncbi:MAG: YlxR family protein [Lachnospiraceae bacterium]|jgi:Predicted nucleic-acid-binding protein implicated in transcription termination|nr:YlxR family protein [Lachnospiraceae bacterium]